MTRRPNPENQARQDQALALLQDEYPMPRSTGEIAKKVWVVEIGEWRPKCQYERQGDTLVRVRTGRGCDDHCPKIWVTYPGSPRADTPTARQALLRLVRSGDVERLDIPESTKTYWRATAGAIDMADMETT